MNATAYSGADAASLWASLILVALGVLVMVFAQPQVQAAVAALPARVWALPARRSRYNARHRAPRSSWSALAVAA